MEIAVRHEKGRVDVTVMSIKGDMTIESYDQLLDRVEQEHELGTNDLVIDLKDVPYISSSGLRAIHRIFTLLEKQDESMRKGMSAGTWKSAHFKLANPSKSVLGVLKATGYDYFLDIYDDLEKAIASF
jgi:anti-anti-sigma factor